MRYLQIYYKYDTITLHKRTSETKRFSLVKRRSPVYNDGTFGSAMEEKVVQRMAKENRKYKDSLFCDLFYLDRDAKANLLSLYNALHGTAYTDEAMIELVRLEDVFFKDMKNDIAFLVGDCQIVLGEHQSTWNENMPLRSLMYVAREYEKLVPVEVRYRSGRIEVPRPEFYTFYNGEDDYPAEVELRLSDAFPASEEEPKLELIVKAININPEKNNPLLANCRVMREYSRFVEETRKHKGDKRALEKSVQECIAKGILAEYLRRKGSEVVNMLMAEYDYDMDIAVQRKEAAEEAEKRGRAEGRELGRAEGRELGRAEGREDGIRLTKEAIKLHEQGKEAEEIAVILEIPVEQVQLMLS